MKTLPRIGLALLLLFAGCRKAPEAPVPAAEETAPLHIGQVCRPGIAAVRLSDELLGLVEPELLSGGLPTRSSELNALAERLGVRSITRVFEEDERFRERQRREGLHRWYYVTFDPEAMPATRAAEEIAAVPGVDQSTLLPRVKNAAIVNDPFYEQQWHLSNRSGIDINVEPVWRDYTVGSPDVIVGIVDGGIELLHEDLQAAAMPGGAGRSRNFIDGSYTITPEGHGTHVAGIIGATSNNGIGVAGIAGGNAALGRSGVRLMSCQVVAESEESLSGNIPDAIRYAADNGALICQNSWGYTFDFDDDGVIGPDELVTAAKTTLDPLTQTAIDYFIKYAGCDNDGRQLPASLMQGGLVVFAAGNDDIPYALPASYEKVLAVASVDASGVKSEYSNYGDWVDICAPGDRIGSTYLSDEAPYVYMSGTSMAAPVVSGVAALVLSARGGQGFTSEMLRDCLLGGASAKKVGSAGIGPLVDALGAVTYDLEERFRPNDPPEIRAAIPDQLLDLDGDERRLELSAYFSDPDGDELEYDIETGNTQISVSAGEGFLILRPQAGGGLTAVTVTARDPRGHSVSQSFRAAARAASERVSVYPTRVRDLLYVGTGEQQSEVSVRIVSLASGSVAAERSTAASVFDPAEFDLSSLAPGRYGVAVRYDGQTHTKTIVKLP